MITFEIRWNEVTDKWQLRCGAGWSEPMPKWKLDRELRRETIKDVGQWGESAPYSKPLDPRVRGKSPAFDTVQRYEIRGGKVQRIPASTKERNEMEVAELLAALEGLDA